MLLLLLAAAARAWVAANTAMPDRDAAHYLWMAQGGVARLFDSVFHPLFPALIVLLQRLLPELEPVVAGQIVSCSAGALAVLPLHAVTLRLFGRTAAVFAGLAYALGVWFARHPADVLSEGPFHLLVAGWAALLVAGRPVMAAGIAGLAAALAYGARPEGATLIAVGLWFVWRHRPHAAVLAFLLGSAFALWFPLGWAWLGPGLTLTPKAGITWAVGAGSGGWTHYARELLGLPGAFAEALGYAVAPLAVVGLCRSWRSRVPEHSLLWMPFAVQLLVVPALFAHWRFLSGYGLLLLPFAGAAFGALLPRLQRLGRFGVAAALLVCFARDLLLLPQVRRADRVVERELGRELGGRLRPGETIASDMPRLDWFAGVRPGPPRPILAAELELAAAIPGTRFVVWVEGRTAVAIPLLEAQGLREIALPLAESPGVRRIRVFGRP